MKREAAPVEMAAVYAVLWLMVAAVLVHRDNNAPEGR